MLIKKNMNEHIIKKEALNSLSLGYDTKEYSIYRRKSVKQII